MAESVSPTDAAAEAAPAPDGAGRPRRGRAALGRALSWAGFDLLAAMAVVALAVFLRVRFLYEARVVADWADILRSANDLATGAPLVNEASRYYTSLARVTFAAFVFVFKNPASVFLAWAAAGGVAAGLLSYATGRVAGWLPGLMGGLILACSMQDIHQVQGLKSTFIVCMFTGLIPLGLWGSVRRRSWGPVVLGLGAASAPGWHLGMWALGIVGSGLALIFALRLPSPRRWFVTLATLAPMLALVAMVAKLDLTHLRTEFGIYVQSGPPPVQGLGLDPVFAALNGVALAGRPLIWLWVAVGVGTLSSLAVWLWRYRAPAGAPGMRATPWEAATCGLLCLGLLAAGGGHFAWQAVNSAYIESHHVSGLLPLAVFTLASLLRAAVPFNVQVIGAVAPALVLGFWLQGLTGPQLSARSAIHPSNRLLDPPYLGDVLRIAKPIRDHAKATGRQPLVFTWLPLRPDMELVWATHAINELSRMALPLEAAPADCVVVTRGLAAATFEGGTQHAIEGTDLIWVGFDGCAGMEATRAAVCGPPGDYQLRRRKVKPHDSAAWAALPCATSEEIMGPR